MAQERRTLRVLLPGLDEQLAEAPLTELESVESTAIELFRAAGGAALLIPHEHRGLGASALAAVRVQRAIGSRAPSLAVATTMHHFSVATLSEYWRQGQGLEWMLLQAIADHHMLLASGFAEGTHGQGVFQPTMRGQRADGVVVLNGTKRPCSLARSMDILTASVAIDGDDGAPGELAIALVSAKLPGIEVRPFWGTPLLAGAQSDAVILRDVAVEQELVFNLGPAGAGKFDGVQSLSFLWFELLITASYLGIASALVERLLQSRRGDAASRMAAVAELEGSMAAIERIAQQLDERVGESVDLLCVALLSRHAAQDAIARATARALESLGGMAFVGSPEVGYLYAAAQALAFHPPSRARAVAALDAALMGAPLVVA